MFVWRNGAEPVLPADLALHRKRKQKSCHIHLYITHLGRQYSVCGRLTVIIYSTPWWPAAVKLTIIFRLPSSFHHFWSHPRIHLTANIYFDSWSSWLDDQGQKNKCVFSCMLHKLLPARPPSAAHSPQIISRWEGVRRRSRLGPSPSTHSCRRNGGRWDFCALVRRHIFTSHLTVHKSTLLSQVRDISSSITHVHRGEGFI